MYYEILNFKALEHCKQKLNCKTSITQNKLYKYKGFTYY